MMQRFALMLLIGAMLGLGGYPGVAQAQQPVAASQPASPQAAVAQAGVKVCLSCHGGDPKVNAVLHSSMAMLGDPRTPMAQDGCQGCHGESLAHASGKAPYPSVVFAGPHASPVEVRNKVCLSCHEAGERMNWQGSTHQRNDIACTNCHTAHAAKDPVAVKLTEPEKCFTCHSQQRSESLKYSHHPIREGKVVCSSCHNPHGTPADTKLLREFTVNQTCYTCHADKRGPLLWEHQPVREDCTICHNPHGSNQPRLMVEQMNFLCASCHTGESNNSGGSFGGAHSIPFRGPGSSFTSTALANQRACLNCHSQIHGSNSPAGAFFFR